MKQKEGKEFITIGDASREVGISVSTFRRYIRNGTFPRPKREFFGSQSVAVFTLEDIDELKKILARVRGSNSL